MKNKERQLELLNQIIEKAQLEDNAYKKRMMAENSAQKSVGDSWVLHHLNLLKKLMSDD